MNIYQKINEVRREVSYVQKDKAVSTGGGSYKAVTHDQVTGLVRQSLIKHGIVIVPTTLEAVFRPKDGDSKQRLYEATYEIQFVNIEQPEERVCMQINAHALDNGDKAPGKALSYATKYAVLKLFSIETGEDEESRYQTEDFDVAPHKQAIEAAGTLEELKTIFQSSYREALASGDKDAMKELMSVKEVQKKKLDKPAPVKEAA